MNLRLATEKTRQPNGNSRKKNEPFIERRSSYSLGQRVRAQGRKSVDLFYEAYRD